jgi:hypothetical protein
MSYARRNMSVPADRDPCERVHRPLSSNSLGVCRRDQLVSSGEWHLAIAAVLAAVAVHVACGSDVSSPPQHDRAQQAATSAGVDEQPCRSPFDTLRNIQAQPPQDLPRLEVIDSLACVRTGWTAEQVLERVGQPYEPRAGYWVYWWIKSEEGGGPYFSAYVHFSEGRVSDLEAFAGHRAPGGMLLD